MVTSPTLSPAQRERDLLGQTLVVIGGSAGIGLETARLARDEGAEVILTARNPDRLHRAGLELGASIAAFDATDFDRLERFFDELPAPIDHVLVTGPGPYYAPFAEFDIEEARQRRRCSSLVAAAGRSERGGQGPAGRDTAVHGRHRRPPRGAGLLLHVGAHSRASRHDEEPRTRARANPREPDRRRVRRHAVVGDAPRRPAGCAPRTAPHDAADPDASSGRPTSPHSPSTS